MSRADSLALMREAELQTKRKEELMATESKVSFSGGHDGKRHAWVKRSPPGEPGRWLTWRRRADGAMDFVTARFFRRAAERDARRYESDGAISGWSF